MGGVIIWLVVGSFFAIWSYVLADIKDKRSPFWWAVLGFFFYFVPVIALLAVHSRNDIVEMLNKGKNEKAKFPDGAQL